MKKKDNGIKFETLRVNYTKPVVIGLVVFIVIMSVLVLKGTRANYQLKQSIPFATGTINYTMPDVQVAELYIDDVRVTNLEENQKYKLDTTKSYCTYKDEKLDVTITYDTDNNKLIVNPLDNKGTKCYVYLDVKNGQTIQEIIASKTISTRDDFSVTLESDTTGTIYSAEDDDGTTYYFAGAPTDNYLYFAGFYWRIIRVNGDGSIRLIYDGTSAISNGTSDSSSQISKSEFNSSYNNNMYVGFMYTSGNVHGLGTSSTIKGVLDTWYTNNLASYASYIDTNAGFCGDRSIAPTSSGTGTGTSITDYGALYRLYNEKSPSYKCEYTEDLYTVSNSSKGNKALTNPIGLITADEVAYAGGVYPKSNKSYYLYTGQYYWTMSPSDLNTDYYAYIFYVYSDGLIVNERNISSSLIGVRPVINLRSDVILSGTGSMASPYKLST